MNTPVLTFSFLREYYRTPVNLALIVIIPIVLILTFAESMAKLAELVGQPMVLPQAIALSALWSAALLTGTAGFFMQAGAAQADSRLVVAGFRTATVVAARLVTVALLGVLITGVSFGTLLLRTDLLNPWPALAAILLAALTYAALGVLVGSLISSELEGSFALLFVFLIDAFVGSPLTGAVGDWMVFLPTHNPAAWLLAEVAGRPHGAEHWWYTLIYLAVLMVLATLAFQRTARGR